MVLVLFIAMNKQDLIAQRLLNGEVIRGYKEGGNSMTPIINHRQPVDIFPAKLNDFDLGDVAFCKVRGNYKMHLVTAKGKKGLQISNNHGYVNGWTHTVFGKVIVSK